MIKPQNDTISVSRVDNRACRGLRNVLRQLPLINSQSYRFTTFLEVSVVAMMCELTVT